MIIGLTFAGKMKTLDDQCIETQFLTVGIPLIPIKSMFVIKPGYKTREGFTIGLHGKSVLKGYMSFLCLAVGIFLLIGGNAIFDNQGFSLLGLLVLGAAVYFFFIYGKSTENENADRLLFQKAVGINALPEYLDKPTAANLRDRLLVGIKSTVSNPDMKWIDLVESKNYDEKLLPALFAAMGYHSRVEEKERFYSLFERLKAEYRKHIAQQQLA